MKVCAANDTNFGSRYKSGLYHLVLVRRSVSEARWIRLGISVWWPFPQSRTVRMPEQFTLIPTQANPVRMKAKVIRLKMVFVLIGIRFDELFPIEKVACDSWLRIKKIRLPYEIKSTGIWYVYCVLWVYLADRVQSSFVSNHVRCRWSYKDSLTQTCV